MEPCPRCWPEIRAASFTKISRSSIISSRGSTPIRPPCHCSAREGSSKSSDTRWKRTWSSIFELSKRSVMATAEQIKLGQPPGNRMPDSQVGRGRIPELDGLRGIAVLMVLGYHLFAYSMLRRPWTGVARLSMLATMPGWLGVDLFFVLSGFLITGILLDTRGDDRYFQNFYARRALRIFPLYYTVLLLIV